MQNRKQNYWSYFEDPVVGFDFIFECSMKQKEAYLEQVERAVLAVSRKNNFFFLNDIHQSDQELIETFSFSKLTFAGFEQVPPRTLLYNLKHSFNFNEVYLGQIPLFKLGVFKNGTYHYLSFTSEEWQFFVQDLPFYLKKKFASILFDKYRTLSLPVDFAFDFHEKKENNGILCFTLSSKFTVWFEEVHNFEYNDTWDGGEESILDNSFLAYKNTPRLNSLIKDLKYLLDSIGLQYIIQYWGNQATPDGILLDGRIIYQEDIDEGRVLLPE